MARTSSGASSFVTPLIRDIICPPRCNRFSVFRFQFFAFRFSRRLSATLQLFQGPPCRLLLGLLLALAFTAAQHSAAEKNLRGKALFVIGAAFRDQSVARRDAKEHLADLLKTGFIILLAQLPFIDVRREIALHDPAGRLVPSVPVNPSEHGLKRPGKNRRLFPSPAALLPLAHAEQQAQPELNDLLRQNHRVDQRGPHLGEISLAFLGKAMHEQVADREAQNRVAQELERLVVLLPLTPAVGDMGETTQKEHSIRKRVAEVFLESR